MQLYLLQRWAPKQKQRIPEIVFDVDTQQNHTTLQLYLFQRWARKMYVVPGVLWVHTSSDELLILSACHWAGLVGDQPPQRGPPCHRGRQTSHLIYTFAGLEELGTIVVSMALWWYHVLTHLHFMMASVLGHTVFMSGRRGIIM